MGTIPAPNIAELGGQIAAAPQNAFAEYQRAAALKQQTQQAAAMAPLQQQQAQQQIDMQRRQMADQDALTKMITNLPANFTLDDIPKYVTKYGGSGQAALNAQAGIVQQRRNLASLSDEQFAQEQKKADLMQGVHDEVTNATPAEKPVVYQRGIQRLGQAGIDVSKEPSAYPGDDVFQQHLAPIRLHSAIVAEAEKDRQLSAEETKASAEKQKADQGNWEVIPALGVRVNKTTGESSPIAGTALSPQAMEGKYVALAQKQAAGQPLALEDKAFMKGYERVKSIGPTATFNLQAAGVNGTPPPTTDASGKPLPYEQQIRNLGPKGGPVKAIIEGRQDPPSSFAQKSPYWLDVMQKVYAIDPDFNQQRAQLRKDYTVGKHSSEINAINTATGHLGELNDALTALDNNNVPLIASIANRLGIAVGATPATTVRTIVHRVGPEISKAYLGAGGSAGERGADEKDFSFDLGGQQLKDNAAITAKLLRSKVSALENQWNQNKAPSMKSFSDQFISPQAKQVLDRLSPPSVTMKAPNGATREVPSDQVEHYKSLGATVVSQ